jgi:serine/threonine-protein kinase RsbT
VRLGRSVTDDICVPIIRDGDIIIARMKVRELATRVGFVGADLTLIAAAVSEIARNIFVYAARGEMIFAPLQTGGRSGILAVGRDSGPDIPDVEQAMQDGFSTGKSLGLGLPGAKRLMDEFEVISNVGIGTTVTMRKWLPSSHGQ